ncbi:LuxR family transcriptional regulator [Glycomyces sp. A-F 0318]|uniref:LuxR family transcriptional regulator n=1 Tax=Glycomyces amatae TaxID=2881355 RepID=UPI001E5805C3|nr:LuxR family transcriptional regulator [Glycomyces amatae]MCD0445464.1 LuxR family transcriptional regulator [Glycomyces amatae]
MQISAEGTVVEELVRAAAESSSGRAGRAVLGGHGGVLGQTLVALNRGAVLDDNPNPGETAFLVIRGRVRLSAGGDVQEGSPFEVITVREVGDYDLEAIEDAVVLLTVVRPFE